MKITNEILKKAAEAKKRAMTSQYHIEDGQHIGTIISAVCKPINDSYRIVLTFELEDNGSEEKAIFKNSTDLGDWSIEPMNKLAEAVTNEDGSIELDELVGCKAIFETATTLAKDKTPFSNIGNISLEYAYEEIEQ